MCLLIVCFNFLRKCPIKWCSNVVDAAVHIMTFVKCLTFEHAVIAWQTIIQSEWYAYLSELN